MEEINKENKVLVSVYIPKELAEWIENEALSDRRSRSGQAVYFLEEARRVREHNRKVTQRQQV